MAVGEAHVFPGFLTAVLKQIFIQSHRLLFSHASAEVRGENTLERNFASCGSLTLNHQVMSPTRSPLTTQAGLCYQVTELKNIFYVLTLYRLLITPTDFGSIVGKVENAGNSSLGIMCLGDALSPL